MIIEKKLEVPFLLHFLKMCFKRILSGVQSLKRKGDISQRKDTGSKIKGSTEGEELKGTEKRKRDADSRWSQTQTIP